MAAISPGYILTEDKKIIKTTQLKAFEWRQKEENKHLWKIGSDDVNNSTVSTVFLCIDHRIGGNGPPVLFETLIIGGEMDGDMWRYTDYEQAVEGHAAAIARVFNNT